jgi:hypothetical protein
MLRLINIFNCLLIWFVAVNIYAASQVDKENLFPRSLIKNPKPFWGVQDNSPPKKEGKDPIKIKENPSLIKKSNLLGDLQYYRSPEKPSLIKKSKPFGDLLDYSPPKKEDKDPLVKNRNAKELKKGLALLRREYDQTRMLPNFLPEESQEKNSADDSQEANAWLESTLNTELAKHDSANILSYDKRANISKILDKNFLATFTPGITLEVEPELRSTETGINQGASHTVRTPVITEEVEPEPRNVETGIIPGADNIVHTLGGTAEVTTEARGVDTGINQGASHTVRTPVITEEVELEPRNVETGIIPGANHNSYAISSTVEVGPELRNVETGINQGVSHTVHMLGSTPEIEPKARGVDTGITPGADNIVHTLGGTAEVTTEARGVDTGINLGADNIVHENQTRSDDGVYENSQDEFEFQASESSQDGFEPQATESAKDMFEPHATITEDRFEPQTLQPAGDNPAPLDDDSQQSIKFIASAAPVYSTLDFLDVISQIIRFRIDAFFDTKPMIAPAAGSDDFSPAKKLWFKSFTLNAKQKEQSNRLGFKNNQQGFMLGLDTEINDDLTAGVAYGFSNSGIKFQNLTNSLYKDWHKANLHIAALYGKYDISPNISINTQLKYGKVFIKTKRHATSDIAYGKSRGDVSGGKIDAAYNLKLDSLTVVPRLGLTFEDFSIKGFTEYGSSQNAKISSRKGNKLLANIDLDLIKPIMQTEKLNVVSGMHFNLNHILSVKNTSTLITLVDTNQPLSPLPINKLQDTYTIGGLLSLSHTNTFEFSINYNYSFRPRFRSRYGSAAILLKF